MTRVTVSMPLHGCSDTVARAVASVLDQDYSDLVLVVVNDGGDPGEVWAPLAHVDDGRLIRFDLPTNRGRYHADAVVLAACATPWFTVHDADDWSEPHRLAGLVDAATSTASAGAFGGFVQHRDGRDHLHRPNLGHASGRSLRQVGHHTAVFDVVALRAIGGPNPDYRFGWDTLMTFAFARANRCAAVNDPAYHHCIRPGSLTQSVETGMGSPARREVHRELHRLWARCRRQPVDRWAEILAPSPEGRASVDAHARRLAGMLG